MINNLLSLKKLIKKATFKNYCKRLRCFTACVETVPKFSSSYGKRFSTLRFTVVNTVKLPVSRSFWDQKKCLLKRGVCLWEVKNDQVSVYERCPPAGGVR